MTTKGDRTLALTDRDLDLLTSLLRYRYLSSSQIQRLHFPSAQTALRRVRLLASAGYISTFRSSAIPDRLATLARGGLEAVAERLSLPASDLDWDARREKPRDALFLRHFLAASDFRITLTHACKQWEDAPVRLLGFLPEHVTEPTPKGAVRKYIREVIADVQEPGRRLTHTPDGVFALERAGKAALFFLEIDRGTQVLSNPDRGVLKTVRFYLNLLLSSAYQRYREDFGVSETFRAFRVLMVVSSPERLENIRATCGQLRFEPDAAKRFIWFTTDDALCDPGILSRQWASLDSTDRHGYTIIAQSQKVATRSPSASELDVAGLRS